MRSTYRERKLEVRDCAFRVVRYASLTITGAKRGEIRVFVLVLLLIGWKSGASSAGQSQSELRQNKGKRNFSQCRIGNRSNIARKKTSIKSYRSRITKRNQFVSFCLARGNLDKQELVFFHTEPKPLRFLSTSITLTLLALTCNMFS